MGRSTQSAPRAYLDAALGSLLAQDFTDFEVTVCDNASTDRTAAIVAAWAAKDARVRVYRNESNIGAEANFNRAFELARGHSADNRVIGLYDGGLTGAESPDAAARFAALVLSRHLCTHLFGVMRTDALRRTRLLEPYYGSDRALLAELGLLGRFGHVPKSLFINREHPGRGSRAMGRWRDAGRGLPSLVL